MSEDALFEMTPRPSFVSGDRVELHTLWGVHRGIVVLTDIVTDDEAPHLLMIAIDGVRHTVDPTHCTFLEETS